MKGMVYDPQKFSCPNTAYEYKANFDVYVELRVRGIPRDLAVVEAFDMIRLGVDMGNVRQLAFACDINQYVRIRFRQVLENKDIKKDLWSERTAVNKLLELVNDESVRDSVRLNAIVQLNVLCGYIQLDEAMSKRIGHTLADFARLQATSNEVPPPEGHSVH